MASIYEAAGHYVSLVVNPWRGRRHTKLQIIRWLLTRRGFKMAA